MVLGIGIDIVEVGRVEEMLFKWGDGFLQRIFLKDEIAYCGKKKYPAQHYAARIAVKEAVLKAFGEGWSEKISWKDILVQRTLKGQPQIALLGKGKKLKEEMGVGKILVSLSHTQNYSVAQALILKS